MHFEMHKNGQKCLIRDWSKLNPNATESEQSISALLTKFRVDFDCFSTRRRTSLQIPIR